MNISFSGIFKKGGSWAWLLGLGLLGTGCAGRSGLENEYRVFTPDELLPLKIAITRPLEADTHAGGHQVLDSWQESPGQRRQLMQCTWNEGLQEFVGGMIPGTEIFFLGIGRDPLAAVGPGVSTEVDTLGLVSFTFENSSTTDVARHLGWTHLVVPLNLEPSLLGKTQSAELVTRVAIIDVQEQRLVWQGELDSRHFSASDLGGNKKSRPELTAYESAVYRFILDLGQVFERKTKNRPEDRNQWATPCQERPPLLEE